MDDTKGLVASAAATRTKEKIVFLAGYDVGFQGLAQAMRFRMPGFDVVLEDPRTMPPDRDHAARLVLVRPEGSSNLAAYLSACRRRFPDAALGLLVTSSSGGEVDCHALLEDRLVQGIVPVDLPLDVWVAVLGLLIAGGEYCPPRYVVRNRKAKETRPQRSQQPPDYAAHGLTPREGQILDLITRGFQNKLIANHMCLSEHTVKVHVHNLFSKLGVSNRTQAAATCRDWMVSDHRPRGRPTRNVSQVGVSNVEQAVGK